MSNWQKNKAAAVTYGDPVSLTDQSQARETDINVIVAKMGITGMVPGSAQPPMYGDWTQFPEGLREYIEVARSLEHHKNALPEQLKGKSVEEILSFTPQEMIALLAPKAPTPTETKE